MEQLIDDDDVIAQSTAEYFNIHKLIYYWIMIIIRWEILAEEKIYVINNMSKVR